MASQQKLRAIFHKNQKEQQAKSKARKLENSKLEKKMKQALFKIQIKEALGFKELLGRMKRTKPYINVSHNPCSEIPLPWEEAMHWGRSTPSYLKP